MPPIHGPRQERWLRCLAPAFLVLFPPLLFRPPLFHGSMIYGYDAVAMLLPFWEEVQRILAQGEIPLWFPSLFGGMPGIASCNVEFLYPGILIGHLAKAPAALTYAWNIYAHVALSGLGMLLLLRRLGRSLEASLLGAAFFAWSGSQISQVHGGYTIFVQGIAMTPWAFWGAHAGATERRAWGWAACGLALGLQILSIAVQLFVCTAVALAAFTWSLGPAAGGGSPAGRWRWLGGFALALLLAFLVSAPQIWPALEFMRHTTRQAMPQEWVVDGSIGLQESLSWLLPGYFGWDGLHSRSFTSEYFGLLPWALAAAALASRWKQESRVRWMAGLALLALFMAQRHWTPYYHLFRHLPGVSGFRIWSRALFLLTFAVCILAAYGWDAMRGGERRPAFAAMGVAAGAMVAVILAGWLAPTRGADAVPALESAVRALALLPPLALLFWALARWSGSAWLLIPAMALQLADQSVVWRRFIQFIDPAKAGVGLKFVGPALPLPGLEPWRTLDLNSFYSNQGLASGYEQLGGQGSVLLEGFVKVREAMRERPEEWLNLMNVRYVYAQARKSRAVDPRENHAAFPRAWLVARSRQVASHQEAYGLFSTPDFDPGKEAALVEGPLLQGGDPAGRLRWLGRSALSATIEAEVPRESLLVLSNHWYPSWRASLGGAPAPLLRANGAFQAVLLPKGRHQVRIHFDRGLFHGSLAACLAGLALLAGLFLVRRPF